MEKSYEVDVIYEGSEEDYEDGVNLQWDYQLDFDSLRSAKLYAEGIRFSVSKVTGVRVVRIDDPGGLHEPHDVYLRFE